MLIKLTKNDFLKEAMGAIIDALENGYNGYLCDLLNEVFNMDYYETNYNSAIKWFDDYEYSVFYVIDIIVTYEGDNFGEVNTDLSNPCAVLNMYWYIIGEEAEDILADGCRKEFDELWNSKLDDNERKFLIAKFKEVYDEWD